MRNFNVLILSLSCCLTAGVRGERPNRFFSQAVSLGRVRGCAEHPQEEPDPRGELAPWLGLLEKERALNPALDKAWAQAWREWALMKEGGRRAPGGLRDELAVAVVCYALEYPPPPAGPLYLRFNQASRSCLETAGGAGGQGPCERFRGLHQLLSSALRGLREAQGGGVKAPATVYRGASRAFWASVGDTVQFGSFTSTSASRLVAEGFAWGGEGQATLFHIRTARGASVEELSPFPQEREVLIPPCEAFRVVNAQTTWAGSQQRIDLHLTSLDLDSSGSTPGLPWALCLLSVSLSRHWC
uniref:ecto-ADP-ribosyltransferase 5-like n=1 Tax=Pristiophorus japonicus TaxID=55135 RepID=UPI00398E8BDA